MTPNPRTTNKKIPHCIRSQGRVHSGVCFEKSASNAYIVPCDERGCHALLRSFSHHSRKKVYDFAQLHFRKTPIFSHNTATLVVGRITVNKAQRSVTAPRVQIPVIHTKRNQIGSEQFKRIPRGKRQHFPAVPTSTFFAVDRYASYRTDWGEIYENGGLILSDRYTTSNAIHQGSKLPEAELPAFFDWLYDLEYGKMGLPRPDLVLYLDVDLPTSLKRMQHRQEKQNTKADIHEQDEAYLENCLRIGRLAAAHYGWTVVPFMKDGAERELEEKHEEIFSIIRSAL